MSTGGIKGRRVHIAGSISPKTSPGLLKYAHELVTAGVRGILETGGGLVLAAGKEPRAEGASPNSPGLTFDWIVLQTVAEAFGNGLAKWPADVGIPAVVVLSEKASSEIPKDRTSLWESLVGKNLIRVEWIRARARSGSMIRERQSQHGDVLVTIGGGTGVEQLADLYLARRQPVIALDLPLGSSRDDGTGGSERISAETRSDPDRFLRLIDSEAGTIGARLGTLMTKGGQMPVADVAKALISLLKVLAPPYVFYVRLLNSKHEAYPRVEGFFRDVVDPSVEALGFGHVDLGTDKVEKGFLNTEIFQKLHYAAVAVVDVTGLRPNCFIELGYALGRHKRVIATAEEGTELPFDQNAIPCHFWKAGLPNADRKKALSGFWRQYIDRAPLES